MSVHPLSKESVPVGFNMDATHSNRFHIWADRNTVRIIFGDSVDGDYLRWFGAVAMPQTVAKDMVKALAGLIKETE
mgnify:CR=1 FL=1